jgi:putative transcriptional regulator
MEGSLSGKLLVAMPGIGDPRFEKAVIMLCHHDETTAMGLIVNKPRDGLTLGQVLEHLNIPFEPPTGASPVLEGGPVHPDRGYVLHSADFESEEGTRDVAPGIRVSATKEVLEALGDPSHAPARFTLMLGYAGWGAGQLEGELARNAWLVAEPDEAILFGDAHEVKWPMAIRQIGIDPCQLVGEMGRA